MSEIIKKATVDVNLPGWRCPGLASVPLPRWRTGLSVPFCGCVRSVSLWWSTKLSLWWWRLSVLLSRCCRPSVPLWACWWSSVLLRWLWSAKLSALKRGGANAQGSPTTSWSSSSSILERQVTNQGFSFIYFITDWIRIIFLHLQNPIDTWKRQELTIKRQTIKAAAF